MAIFHHSVKFYGNPLTTCSDTSDILQGVILRPYPGKMSQNPQMTPDRRRP